jgi:hypothetical protein
MKYLIGLLLVALHLNAMAQIKGNKKMITTTYALKNVKSIEMNLYAEVVIDCAAEEKMTITAEENMLDLIEKSVEDGHLQLTQKEWIQPNYRIKIQIGAPGLERIQHTVHETTVVQNIDRPSFRPMAIIGKLVLKGKASSLFAAAELGEIDARQLEVETATVNLWSQGSILLGSPVLIEGKVKEDGLVNFEGDATRVQVNTGQGGRVVSYAEMKKIRMEAPRYIEFKLKNNSRERIQCYVVGPKPDGRKFSYGFPMNPGQVRKKNWTIGSKVYRKGLLGTRKLLAKIEAGDEGEVVKIQ